MVSTRRKSYVGPKNETLDSHNSPSLLFQTLISHFGSPQGLEAPLLKSLHFLLIHLSSNTMRPVNNGADPNKLIMEFSQTGIRVSNKDLCRLSDMLFEELCKRFKQLFSATYDVYGSKVLEKANLLSDAWAAAEELNLLLRCCLTYLNLLVEKQQLIMKNGKILLTILRKLSLLNLSEGKKENNFINFVQSFTSKCTYSDNDCAIYFTDEFVASFSFVEPSDPCIPFVSGILEVFLDELLVQEQLRKYMKLIDSVNSTCEMPFMPSSVIDNIGTVIEIMCGHFSVSIPHEKAFEDFLNRLCSLSEKNFRAPELSLKAAVSLLCNPVLFSAPKLMQAHMISLISKANHTDIDSEIWKPDLRQTNCCLIVFEKSVNLYTKLISSVKMDDHPPLGGNSFAEKSIYDDNFQSCFESYVQPARRKKLDDLITKLDDSWHSRLRSVFFKTQCHLVTSSIAYIKENQCILDAKHRNEILSVLSCMILRAGDDYNNVSLPKKGDISLEDICVLASLLKLMSVSLLKVIRSLRRGDESSCKEYDSIVGILGRFRELNIDLPNQKFFNEKTETHQHKHKDSKPVLLHFLRLLSLSFVTGIEFLAKGCVSVIMVLMNLFVYEEGNLDALSSLIDQQTDSLPNESYSASVQKGAMDQKPSIVLASKFQKIQSLYLSTASSSSACVGSKREENDEGKMEKGGVDIEEETCNGEIFLKTINRCQNLSKYDDLTDFIACKQGKDYRVWLKTREKYRKWKCEKMAALRWERKKRTWKFMKGR